MRRIALLLACCLLLSGCLPPGLLFPRTGNRSAPGGTPDLLGHVGGPAPGLHGSVSFATRSAQGALEEVAVGATVSLINTGSNQTAVTGLTDTLGNFALAMPRGFRPDPTAVYYLEAVKGIGGNLPGNPAVRIRTIAKYRSGGWVTLSSNLPNGGIRLSPASTALAIGAALLRDAGRTLSLDALLGSLSGSAYAPVEGLSGADFESVKGIVAACLAERRDPLASVGFNTATGSWERTGASMPMIVSAIVPPSADPGTQVSFTGQGFIPGDTAVARFNGTPQTASSLSAVAAEVTVPAGATSGQTTLQIGSVIALGPLFTVPVRIQGLSRLEGDAGTSLTVSGTGFDPSTLSHNEVWFGGSPGTVTEVTPTHLVVTVPTDALAGPLTVSVLGSSAESEDTFYPTLRLTGFSPASGAPGETVTLVGTGFHTVPAQNQVNFGGIPGLNATPQPGGLAVTVPPGAMSGPIEVIVNGTHAASDLSFTLAGQGPPFANALIETIAGTNRLVGAVQANNWPLMGSDIAISPSGAQYLATVHGVVMVTPDGVATMLVSAAELDNGILRRLACDEQGRLYIGTMSRIYRYAPGEGLSHVAGNGGGTTSGDGGSAPLAGISYLKGLAVDHLGDVYFIDNARIRKIDPSGLVATVAGPGSGYLGDGGPADQATLYDPRALAVDPQGAIYVSDFANHRIRRIDANGVITTVAGNGIASNGCDGPAGSTPVTPLGLALGPNGVLYFADFWFSGQQNYRLRTLDLSTGMISSRVQNGMAYLDARGVAGVLSNFCPEQVAVSPDGGVFAVESIRTLKWGPSTDALRVAIGNETTDFGGDGIQAKQARLFHPDGLAKDASGNLYVADSYNNRVRKISPSGIITTVAGNGTSDGPAHDGMPAIEASLGRTTDVAVGSLGLYVACADSHRVWRVDPDGTLRAVIGNGNPGQGGDGGPAVDAQLARPVALCLDPGGTLFVAESDGRRIRRIGPDQRVSTIAGNGDAGYYGEGGLATATGIGTPAGLACDAEGRLYLSDQQNHAIRRIEADGTIWTVAGGFGSGYGGDEGPAYQGRLAMPAKLSYDGSTLYVADSGNHCIRAIDSAGVIRTVAGLPEQGGFGNDGGAARAAMLCGPGAILADPGQGRLLVADSENNRIRGVR
ncbi:MAG TPA: IPT/TIG domain-containing protein [Pantanalinema sp.]